MTLHPSFVRAFPRVGGDAVSCTVSGAHFTQDGSYRIELNVGYERGYFVKAEFTPSVLRTLAEAATRRELEQMRKLLIHHEDLIAHKEAQIRDMKKLLAKT